MAGGTITFEAAACGLPMILIATAENQVGLTQAWHERGIAVKLGRYDDVSAEQLLNTFWRLTEVARRQQMSNRGRAAVDGKGAERIAKILLCSIESR